MYPLHRTDPRVLFKALTLMVKDYTQLYVHLCLIYKPYPTNQIKALKALRYCKDRCHVKIGP